MTWSYPAIMGLAIAAGALISRRTQQPLGLNAWERLGLGLGAFCGAMIGAKLPFVLTDWPGLMSGAAWFSDGKTIVLGLVGGYFGVELAKWTMGLRIKTGDSFAVPVAVSVSIGRLACFVGGCCYGAVTDCPLGVDFGDGLRRHPTQLYESVFHLTLAGVLYALWRSGAWRGQLIKFYIITYLAYRFATEWIRPEPKLWYDLTGYQLAALVLIPLFAALWAHGARGTKASESVGN